MLQRSRSEPQHGHVYIHISLICKFLTITVFSYGTSRKYWNRLIRSYTQMISSICFQVVETEPSKHFFCSYFEVIHDFIKCRSTFVRSGIISKVCKVRTIVLKKQITNICVKQQRRKYRSLRYTINNV